ncbi:MAG: BlaI/MecI/CopY family transcriptional regulator [Mycobacteriales bacterium]
MSGFGELESVVMDLLWSARRPMTIRQVLAGMPPDREPAYTTVQTVMDRLTRKGVLVRRRAGKANTYRPVRTREDDAAAVMQQALHLAGDPRAALLHFVERLDPDQARALRAALAERRAR